MPVPSGERHYAAKLTKAKVISMRMLHNTPCECCGQRLTVRALARKFGVSKATAGHALTGRTWDIPGLASAIEARSDETPKSDSTRRARARPDAPKESR